MKKDRIPEQVLPGNYYDGEILYGSEMNKIVNILRTGVNANKEDIDNLILDVEKYASITNLGMIDFSELDDITQVGIYKFTSDDGYNYLLFQTFANGLYTQTIYSGNFIKVRRGFKDNWSDWENIDLSYINLNKGEINALHNNLNLVENKVNKNTDDISDLNSSLNVVNAKVDNNIAETNKKLDKETYQEQSVNSMVNVRGGIKTNYISSPTNRLVIDSHAYIGTDANMRVHAGEYYEGLTPSNDTRLATRKYVIDRFAELVGNSPEALDTLYELAEALKNNPDVIDELLNEISEVDAKSTENKNTIDNIISGRQTVGKALTALNLTSQERHPIEDLFSTRITAKYENDIISSIDEETTAVIDELGGFSVKQLVRNNNFETNSDWEVGGLATNLVIANNEGSYVGSANAWSAMWQVYELPIKNGDKYYISAEIMPPSDIASGSYSNLIGFRYTNGGIDGIRVEAVSRWSAKANVWNKISGIRTINYYQQGVEPIYFALQTYETAGTIRWRNPVVINLTELGLDHLTVEQVEYLLGNRHYPFGITNTKPSKLISVGENLFDWREFYEALKAVDPNNVQIVSKDGRECIKITNPRVYLNKIKLWQGKFAPNVRYRFSSYHLNEGTTWGAGIGVIYTDGTLGGLAGNIYYDTWNRKVKDTLANKTIDYVTVFYNSNSQVVYFDINTLQLQMLDNPETEFIPYAENEVELPAYEDYGIPSLPNGVRDRIFRLGDRPDNSEWFYEKNVGKVVFDGSEDFIRQKEFDTTVLFYYAIDNIKSYIWPQQISVMNDFFTSVVYDDIYSNRAEGIASRSDQKGLVVGIKKSRIPDWNDSWTNAQKVNAFKQWLQANPITVYYQLDEPQLIRIGNYNSQYLAYNYGREDIVDSEGNTTPAYTVIKYYPDYKKQVQTNSEILQTQKHYVKQIQTNSEILQTQKQDKLIAGDNITIDPATNVISATGGKEFYRVRIFDDSDNLISTQILYTGEKVLPLDRPGNIFYYGTRDPFDYDTVITGDLDLTYSIIPPRYIQTTVEDFDENGDYIGTGEYIILPKDKPRGYKIQNVNVKGVATSGDYLTDTSYMFSGNNSLYLELDYLDTSNVTNMGGMFAYSQAITLDLSNFDTSNVTNMQFMFYNSKTTTLDLSNFDTSKVTSMFRMFYNSKATVLDLSSFDTSHEPNMSDMFTDCQATIGYARTQADADRFNSSSGKPSTLTFVVK